MQIKLRNYKKEFEYSYALGASPVIELLENRPADCFGVVLSPGYTDKNKIKSLCKKNNITVEENQKIINILSPKENCYVLGAFYKRVYKLEKNSPHVLLDNPSDMGNLGAVIRSCAGFGVNNLAVIGGADAYNPKAVRASMGAFFHVNLEYFKNIRDYLADHGQNRELYAFMLKAEFNLTDLPLNDRIYSLIFGNEASGLEYGIYENIANTAVINHTNAVDSLSLPVAAGIALFWFNKNL
ncbi:MAG: TrmH family RNA methyltransferase [Oscillospiraceae bacterium]|nr:TrmH family RNA methyltransferase [Oscillospiraceae bacterium]